MSRIVTLALPVAGIVLLAANTANADPLASAEIGPRPVQVAALPPSFGDALNRLSLPTVIVNPSADGSGPRAGSSNTVKSRHFRVWAGYDLAAALHPYTSGIGPCPEGSNGSGCSPGKGEVIRPSHYERSPFSD